MLALDGTLDISCCVAWYPATNLAETMRTVRDGEYSAFGTEENMAVVQAFLE